MFILVGVLFDEFDVTSLLSPCHIHLPLFEAQKESSKRGELERSPNKRREVAPVRSAQPEPSQTSSDSLKSVEVLIQMQPTINEPLKILQEGLTL